MIDRDRVIMSCLPTQLSREELIARRDAALVMAGYTAPYVCNRAEDAQLDYMYAATRVMDDLETALDESWGKRASIKITWYAEGDTCKRIRFVTALLLEAARHYHFCAQEVDR